MNRILFSLFAVLALVFSAPAYADGDRIITFDQLPQASQTFLKQYFPDRTPILVKADRDDYEVAYENGESVEFTRKGEWKSIDCKFKPVPEALIPAAIKERIATNYPNASIIKISKDRKGYEVELNNGLDIEFNNRFVIVDIDD